MFFNRLLLVYFFIFGSSTIILQAQEPDTVPPVKIVQLERGTPVTLKLEQALRSDQLEENSIIPLTIALDVVSQGERLAITGAYGEARVRRVSQAKNFGKGGFLEIEAINMQLIDGQRARLVGERHKATGKNRKLLAWTVAITAPIIGAVFASAAGNSEAAPFMIPFAGLGLLVKGREAEFPVGTLLEAEVYRDISVRIEQ